MIENQEISADADFIYSSKDDGHDPQVEGIFAPLFALQTSSLGDGYLCSSAELRPGSEIDPRSACLPSVAAQKVGIRTVGGCLYV